MEETKSRKLHPVLEVLIIAGIIYGVTLLTSKASTRFLLSVIHSSAWSNALPIIYLVRGMVVLFLASLICFKLIEKRPLHWGAILLISVVYRLIMWYPKTVINVFVGRFGSLPLARYGQITGFVSPVLTAIIMVLLVHLLTAPKKEVTASDPAMHIGLVGHVLLLLFTFGIWHLIWIYRTTRYLNCVTDEPYRNPATKLLLCMLVPFYAVYWVYKSAQRIDKLAKTADIVSDLAVVCLILELFVPLIPPILMQDKINKIVEVKQNNPER